MNGKGSKQRPTDMKKYHKNYEKVFDKDIKNIADEANVNIDPDSGAISISNKGGTIKTRERKIVVKREYVDHNGIEMCIVNIDDALTNRIITKRQLKVLQHGIVNEEHPDAIKAAQEEAKIDAELRQVGQRVKRAKNKKSKTRKKKKS